MLSFFGEERFTSLLWRPWAGWVILATMPIHAATHSGPFHADDVVAWALIRQFLDPLATVERTRDAARWAAADLVFDVGAVFDPASGRFDHHQHSYEGPLSSAGMVLSWLEDEGRVSSELAAWFREEAFTYLDDVDNGRVAPRRGVPCLPRMIDSFNQLASTPEEFDVQFAVVSELARSWLVALAAEHQQIVDAREAVAAAMAQAEARGSNLLELDSYLRWKQPYFELGGAEHCTEYALFPGTDDSWRVIGIPPKFGDFGQKRSLPLEWAGLSDQELVDVVGVEGARFCHKNRFIAVFDSREQLVAALERWGLLS